MGFHPVACLTSALRRSAQVFVDSVAVCDAILAPGFERPKLMPTGKQQLFSSTDEFEARPFTDGVRGSRTLVLKIHKRSRLAMGFTSKRMPYEKNAQKRGAWPVHKLDCKVLMSRAEFRSRNYIPGPGAATKYFNLLDDEHREKSP
jgi:hypothetical protein